MLSIVNKSAISLKELLVLFLGFCLMLTACSERIRFSSGNIKLAGSLALPEGEGPFPAIVFVHGSGRATRHRFNRWATYFEERGIASLRYDKRGTGFSEGTFIR